MKRILPGLTAGVVAFAAASAPAALAASTADAAAVTVRVEGASRTLVPATAVTTARAPVRKQADPAQTCAGRSLGGALEAATGGRWGGGYGSFGQSVETILGESYPLAGPLPRYWALWVNGKPATTGACDTSVRPGDEVLVFVDCYGAGCVSPAPLVLSAPRLAVRGRPVTVTVRALAPSGKAAPAPGVAVHGAGATARTGADGKATLVPTRTGAAALRASGPNVVRTEALLAVTAPRAGRDRTAPRARFVGLRARRLQILQGRASVDPSGLRAVQVRLERRRGSRCAGYAPGRERFVRVRCGHARWIGVGSSPRWALRLGAPLARGAYTLETRATDRAGNRGRPAVVRLGAA
jgi:hypothetical protein